MLHLRLSADESGAGDIERRLLGLDGVRRIVTTRQQAADEFVVTADVDPVGADELVGLLSDLEIEADDYVLTRMDVVAPVRTNQEALSKAASFAWIEVLGEARANSRPMGRFLVLMAVAGVIAALGVLDSNTLLIVGAMAVSPDLLPVCATCVGLMDRRGALTRRSASTLVVGLGLTAVVALALTLALRAVDIIAPGYMTDQSGVIATLANVDYSTVLVALAAGVAAMISFETRASAAVGVAISVTTIPAAAYIGVAFGLGDVSDGLGSLLVLSTNVVLLLVSGCLTLAVQRRAAARASGRTRAPRRSAADAT
ncbi:MAG: DUF389 domain-containing protein [Actinomycetota bacterium]|nr:DUF389 domain-containing protein [Actinomycetota bacterium]